jgi:hypothetical protein
MARKRTAPPAQPAGDARAQINQALENLIEPEQLKTLLDEVLKITKSGRGWCPKCKHAVFVEVPDAKAVVGAMGELLNQAKGRPTETKQVTEIVVERNVYLVTDEQEGSEDGAG